ncbi:hypothetical protein NON20_24440 (plasmid) [Synechocystis sp. B12]|nr:hypothetical protein NON20_24440 [Synechocystis sp. B12]
MKLIEHYRQYGLEKPIHFRAGFIFHLLLWCCLGFIIGGIVMVVEMDIIGKLIGIFSFLFFGFAFLVMLSAWFKSGRYGLCMLSKEGLYMSHINITIPWQDIGPAWIHIFQSQGTTTKNVCYSLRNISRHRNRMGFTGKILIDLQKFVYKSKSGGKSIGVLIY